MVMQVVKSLKGSNNNSDKSSGSNSSSNDELPGKKKAAVVTNSHEHAVSKADNESSQSLKITASAETAVKDPLSLELLQGFETTMDSKFPFLTGGSSSSNQPLSAAAAAAKSVDPRRKEQLLLQARADRLRWMEQVALPYRATATNTDHETTAPDHQQRLEPFRSSHAARELPTALPLLQHLYAMSSSVTTTADNNNININMVVDRIEQVMAQHNSHNNNNSKALPTPHQILTQHVELNRNDPVLQAYQHFWNNLHDRSCAMLVQGMRTFCHNWQTLTNPTVMASQLSAYLESTLGTIIAHPVWKRQQQENHKSLLLHQQHHQQQQPQPDSSYNDDTILAIRRSLESFMYGQCQAHLESVLWNKQAMAKEEEWQERLASLQFVTPAHLEIACLTATSTTTTSTSSTTTSTNDDLLRAPMQALASVDGYYSPYEKLQRILAVYRSVNAALSHALNQQRQPVGGGDTNDNDDDHDAKEKTKKLPSADDVLPTMIWVLLRARPRRLLYHLQLLEEWSRPEYLRGEAGYAYTNLYGAVHFLQDLDLTGVSNSLSISARDFHQGLENCRAVMEAKNTSRQQQQAVAALGRETNDTTATNDPWIMDEVPRIPPHEIRAARLRGEEIDLEWARQWQQDRLAEQEQQQPQTTTTTTATTTSTTSTMTIPAKSRDDKPLRSAFDEAADALPAGFIRDYTFLTCSPEDIRLTDLPQLLAEYRMLVHATESLIGDRAAKITVARRAAAAAAKKDLFDRVRQVDPSLLPAANGSPWRKNNNNTTSATTPGGSGS